MPVGVSPTPVLTDVPWGAAGAPIVGSWAMKLVASGAWMLPRALLDAARAGVGRSWSWSGAGMTMPICAAIRSMRCSSESRGDARAQQLVLSLQGGAALERAADAGVELEDLDLHGHDSGQQDAQQRDPHAAADDPVEQRVVGQRADVGRGAQAPRRLGGGAGAARERGARARRASAGRARRACAGAGTR